MSKEDLKTAATDVVGPLNDAQGILADSSYELFERLTGYRLASWDQSNHPAFVKLVAVSEGTGEEKELKLDERELKETFGLDEKAAFVLISVLEADMALSNAMAFLK